MPTRNLRNPRIAQRELGIHTLACNPGIARPIPLLRTRDVEQTFDLSTSTISAGLEMQLARIHGHLEGSKMVG